jgi:predicted GIY-YIG superfamily endonuclease
MTLRYGWSLEEKDWSEIPGEIKNGDWKKIKYHPQNEQFIPQSSGLYIIEGITNNTFPIQFSTPMYIGYTLALRRRYIEHLSTKGKKIMELNLNCTFNYIELESYLERDLKILETILIRVFGPVINERRPISKGVKIVEKIKESSI